MLIWSQPPKLAWTPGSLAGLKLWLAANEIVGLANGDPVGTWPDLSGNGNDATQGTAANKPLWYTSTQTMGANARPIVWFDGTNDQMATGSMLGAAYNTAITVFLVARKAGTALKVALADSTGPYGKLYMARQVSGANKFWQYYTEDLTDTLLQYNTPDITPMRIETLRYNGSARVLRIDGVQVSSVACTGNLGLTGGVILGNNAGSFQWDGGISEVLVFNRVLSDVECLRVERWLANKYGMNQVFVFDGDSLTFGTGSTPGNDYPAQCMALLGGAWDSQNFGLASATIVDMESDGATQVDPYSRRVAPKNLLSCWGGTNDLFTDSAATVWTNIQTYCNNRRARNWRVVLLTVLPRSAPGTPGDFETKRQALNTLIRAGYTGCADVLADVAADDRIGDAGDEEDTTYYDADLVHLNDTGYGVVAEIVAEACALT